MEMCGELSTRRLRKSASEPRINEAIAKKTDPEHDPKRETTLSACVQTNAADRNQHIHGLPMGKHAHPLAQSILRDDSDFFCIGQTIANFR